MTVILIIIAAFMPKKAKTCPVCGYKIRENYDDPHQH